MTYPQGWAAAAAEHGTEKCPNCDEEFIAGEGIDGFMKRHMEHCVARCDTTGCDGEAIWWAGTAPSQQAVGDLGKWCPQHLGEGLDGYDGTVTLTNVSGL